MLPVTVLQGLQIHHSTIPIFQHSSEVIGKPTARGTGNKLTGNLKRNNGMMEFWNNGRENTVAGSGAGLCALGTRRVPLPLMVFPNIPSFHYSNIPVKL
jgi:hypothetical protein